MLRRTAFAAFVVISATQIHAADDSEAQTTPQRTLLSKFIDAVGNDADDANDLWSELCVQSGFKEHRALFGEPFEIWPQPNEQAKTEEEWLWVRHGDAMRAVRPDGKVFGAGGIVVNEEKPQVVWTGTLSDGTPGIVFFNPKKDGEKSYLMFLSVRDRPVIRLMVHIDEPATVELVSAQPDPRIELRSADGRFSETFALLTGDFRQRPWKVIVEQ